MGPARAGLKAAPFSAPHVVMAKHSSTWETLALNFVCAPLAFVAKKELLSIPFEGGAMLRRQASEALEDVLGHLGGHPRIERVVRVAGRMNIPHGAVDPCPGHLEHQKAP